MSHTAFHVAPIAFRESIAAHGLNPFLGDHTRDPLDGHPGNWLWKTASEAIGYVRPGQDEVWTVDLTGLEVILDWMNDEAVLVVYDTIPPEKLT